MITLIDLINYGFAAIGLTVAIMGLFLTITTTYMSRWNKLFFKVFFCVLIAYISADLLEQIFFYIPGEHLAVFTRLFLFFESLFSALLPPLLTVYILKCSGKKAVRQPEFYITALLFLIYSVILIITQFTKNIYYITDDNVYHRGTLYPLLLVVPAVMMIVNCITLIRKRKVLNCKQMTAFLCYLLIPLACMLVQMKFYGLMLVVIGTSVSAMILFMFVLNDQLDKYIKQREENLEAQASILVLQMRPHFIYNTMTSIYYLCEQDPQKAMKTIDDFTNYLRKNFSAIAKHGTIPFSEELAHVRTYLEIEKTRFEESLFVDFDIPYSAFRLPPLTLQPIVENSVKYGVDPELEPLHITISTREVNLGSEITVRDTGPGFPENNENKEDDREPHIALDNIRERLALMCNGTLTISPAEGGGTIVTIFIPNKK